ncbi:ras-like protein family member 12 [Styela clava]|uniref:ras-like protein family member 12 n=1 Tax=Styela clava TaxID=7725 RepID=UPI0019393F48|nr:ras-like protein family member 12 [Styela clava]
MWSNEKYSSISATVTVFGCSGVGKTALVVRYLTKRYIGDYISGTDITYKCELNFMRRQVEVQIVDTSGITSKDRVIDVAKNQKTDKDVIMLVYSFDDRSSFDFVVDILPHLSEAAPRASLLVVGNKSDLDESCNSYGTKMKRLQNQFSFTHVTVSAKSSCGDATRVFTKSIGLVIKRRMMETSASSNDLTVRDEDRPHDFKFPLGSRRSRSGGPDAKLPRRATVGSGLGLPPTPERRLSDRLPSVDFTIVEEDLELDGRQDNTFAAALADEESLSRPQPKSISFRKRKKIPPASIVLYPPSGAEDDNNNEVLHLKDSYRGPPLSAPLPSNPFPVFRFPEVSCAAEFRYASLPTSPNSVLKRNNSFLNKVKSALTAVPQRLRSPK